MLIINELGAILLIGPLLKKFLRENLLLQFFNQCADWQFADFRVEKWNMVKA
jgi:hypothetical protein